MKTHLLRILPLLLLSTTLAFADGINAIAHQGRIAVNGANFDGTGGFKFLLFYDADLDQDNGNETPVWKNDNSAPASMTEPAALIAGVTVTKGLYRQNLGDTAALPAPFPAPPTPNHRLYLRTWFVGGGFPLEQLSPDQEIASVPYALFAARVAEGSVTSESIADGSITATDLSGSAAITDAQISDSLTVGPGGSIATAALDSTVMLEGENISLFSNDAGYTTLAAASSFLLGNDNTFTGLNIFSATRGLLATGSFGSGSIPATGPGTRMMWFPGQGAFRAGVVDGTQWDTASVGLHSMALGQNTTASGNNSLALGSASAATGPWSAAIGSDNAASGSRSQAIGSSLEALSAYEIVLGRDNTSYVPNSTLAWDAADRLLTLGNGDGVTASDALVILKSGDATLHGNLTVNGSLTFGQGTSSTANQATAWGNGSAASGNNATAFGANTTASSARATSFGDTTTASGNDSTAFGSNTQASTAQATAFGLNTQATALRATAFGNATIASGRDSLAGGVETTAPSRAEVAFGAFNTAYTPDGGATGWDPDDRLLVLGNGSDDLNRSDALIAEKDGDLIIAGDFKHATPQVRYLQVAGHEFVSQLASSAAPFFNDGRVRPFSSTNARVAAALHLPQGAVVTGLDWLIYDDHATDDFTDLDMQLVSQDPIALGPLSTHFSLLNQTTSGNAASMQIFTGSMAPLTIDNATRIYRLTLNMEVTAVSAFLRCHGVRVTYEVSTPTP